MNGQDESEQAQILQTFSQLAPLLDAGLKLTPNPRHQKLRRTDGPKPPGSEAPAQMQQETGQSAQSKIGT